MKRFNTYLLPVKYNRQHLISALRQNFTARINPPEKNDYTYFDTFDWLLYQSGLYLVRDGNRYHLHAVGDDQQIAFQVLHGMKIPGFWWDFPKGLLRNRLRSVIGVRALLEFSSAQRTIQSIQILNTDRKTIVWADLENLKIHSKPMKKLLYIKPVRGYAKEFNALNDFINGLQVAGRTEPALIHIYRNASRTPGEYTSKMNISLSPEMSAYDATCAILRFLVGVAKQNIDGIRQDIDTEFLHDFRVAIRRTRSALSLLKGVFNADSIQPFKGEFSKMGKTTNRLRDLDVYLLTRDNYYALLPESLRPGLNVLFAKLARQRSWELKRISIILGSKAFDRIITSWQKLLTSKRNKIYRGPRADEPIPEIAGEYISKEFSKVVRYGERIHPHSADEELHRLRIECKKLRYLLEFFTSLFPGDDMEYLIRQLRKLQDNLGEFNDLSIQQMTLSRYLDEVNWQSRRAYSVTAALGGLIASMYNRQRWVKKSFHGIFTEFASPENIQRFERLFGT